MVGPGRRVGSWPSPSPISPLYSSSDSALLRLIIVSRSDPKEMEDVREREERGVDGFEDKRERGVPSLPCTCERERCQVLKGF